jgi:hypothetical protein
VEYRNFFHFGRAAPTPVSQPFESYYVFNDLQSELRRYTEAELLVYQGTLIFAGLVIQHLECVCLLDRPLAASAGPG